MVAAVVFLIGEVGFNPFFSKVFFLPLFFCDFDKVAVDGVTGNFPDFCALLDDLKSANG